MTFVPSRFKQANVDRFVRVLQDVANGVPTIRFNHDKLGLNANTAISRVRDAVLAVTRGITPLPEVDADKLRENWPLYKVEYDNITLEVVVRRSKEHSIAVEGNFFDATLRVEESTFEVDLKAFATLYGHYRMKGRLTIIGLLDDSIKQDLIKNYNVFLEQVAANEHILT